MKTIVISGINLFEGGPLSVYYDCLNNIFELELNKNHFFVLFVNNLELFDKYLDVENFEFVELPKSRKNYLFRLWYEYIYFYLYSKRRRIDIWLSLHDITPNVISNKRYVYCHNPSPFMKASMKNIKYGIKYYLFALFYKYLYKINIKKNDFVIVQQNWIRKEFIKLFEIDNVIVARPSIPILLNQDLSNTNQKNNDYIFIYPVFPRFFKNFEIIGYACQILIERGISNFQVIFTIDGSENTYSKYIFSKFKDVKNIRFIGLQTRETVYELYNSADCLVFSSKLETWGLPISEFKKTNKPIILADLPYAYETIGDYNKVSFFNVDNFNLLADIMEKEIFKNNSYEAIKAEIVDEPFCNDWKSLLERIMNV